MEQDKRKDSDTNRESDKSNYDKNSETGRTEDRSSDYSDSSKSHRDTEILIAPDRWENPWEKKNESDSDAD